MLFLFLFSWLLGLFKTGLHRDLKENDLYETLNDHKSNLLGDLLERYLYRLKQIKLYYYLFEANKFYKVMEM